MALAQLNPKAVFDFINHYSNDFSETIHRLMSIMNMDLRNKVANVLYSLYRQFGVNSISAKENNTPAPPVRPVEGTHKL